MSNYVAGGVGKAIMFLGDQLYGVASTLTDNTFDFTITGDEIRGGRKNMLLAQYFHDSALSINLTNALFNIDDISLALGLPLNNGGLVLKETQIESESVGNKIKIKDYADVKPMNGKYLVWFKKPTEEMWNIGTMNDGNGEVTGNEVSIAATTAYCVKYFVWDDNARSMTLKADYEPSEIHLVILQDLFATEGVGGDIKPGAKAGTLITDIPRFKPNGNQNLAFTATGTGTTSLSGNALAVIDNSQCGETYTYGTMTEQIADAKWQDRVSYVAVENSEIELARTSGRETLIMRAIFKDGSPSQRVDNKYFTFEKVADPNATANNTEIGSSTGEITAGAQTGAVVFSATLKGYDSIDPAYAHVTVA